MRLQMTKSGLSRMLVVALGAAGVVAVVAAAAAFVIGGGGFGLAGVVSAFAAFVAVAAPQVFILSAGFVQSWHARRAFSLWMLRFSLILLLMAVAMRGLSGLAMLAAPGFVVGVIAGVGFNTYLAARMIGFDKPAPVVVYNGRRID